MTSLQTFSITPPSWKQPTRTIYGKFRVDRLVTAGLCKFVLGCEIYQIGRFQQSDAYMVANFALNIRGSRDVREETRSILEHLVGDGILIVSTSRHSTLLVPAFSEFSIFAWHDGSEIVLFDAYESFRAFLDEQGISAGINRNRISQFLASDRIHNNQSTFSGLVEVEHGSSVTSLSGEPITSLIELNHLPDLVCNAVDTSLSYSDASETVRSLVFEAVKAKASPSDVGISTSGGFDSSLLGLLYGREFPDKVPHLYHVYSSAIHGFNEIDYFNDVRQRLEHRVTWLDTENTRDRRLDFPHMVPAFRPPLVSGWYERNWMLYAAAKADGVKTLLSGDGGDQLMLCLDEMSLANEFHEEGITLLRSVVNEALLKQTSIWGVLYAWLSRRSDRSMTRWIESDLDNITPVLRFLKDKHLFPSDTFTDSARYKRLSISRRFQICTLNDAKYNSLAEVLGICERKPFLYWPLVRFCISCPRSILFGGGRERGLFRHAFSDGLPRSVANRIGKSGDLNVRNLFDYEAVKNKILASDFIADFLNMDAVSAINPHHLDDETAEFIMRCATVDAYLKTL